MEKLHLFWKLVFVIGCWSASNLVVGEPASFPLNSRLCTNMTDGIYRFHNETQACYKVGSKGPCRDMMIFYADPKEDELGQCDCDLSYRCNRPMVYWPTLDRCFLVYEQGPCPADSWVTFGWNLEPTCSKNPCRTSEVSEFDVVPGEFWFFYENQCILTGTQGLCPFSNEMSLFNGFSHHVGPYCSPVNFECKLPEIPSLICVPGQKWHRTTGCGLWDPNRPMHPHRHSHHKNRGHRHHHAHAHAHGNHNHGNDHHHKQGFQHNHDHDFHTRPALPMPFPKQRPSQLPPPLPTPYSSPMTTVTTTTRNTIETTQLPTRTIPTLPPAAPTRTINQRPLPQIHNPEFSGIHTHEFHESDRFRNSRNRGLDREDGVLHVHDN